MIETLEITKKILFGVFNGFHGVIAGFTVLAKQKLPDTQLNMIFARIPAKVSSYSEGY